MPPINAMNESQLALKTAYEKGYRVKNNCVYSFFKNCFLKLQTNQSGYLYFNIKLQRKSIKVFVHRLVAYEKYKDKLFDQGIVVRHLNGNQKDNSFNNICIGTQQENMLDRKPGDRLQHAIKASRSIKRFTNEEINCIKQEHSSGMGYKALMEKFQISSKGTLHFILNNEYVT